MSTTFDFGGHSTTINTHNSPAHTTGFRIRPAANILVTHFRFHHKQSDSRSPVLSIWRVSDKARIGYINPPLGTVPQGWVQYAFPAPGVLLLGGADYVLSSYQLYYLHYETVTAAVADADHVHSVAPITITKLANWYTKDSAEGYPDFLQTSDIETRFGVVAELVPGGPRMMM